MEAWHNTRYGLMDKLIDKVLENVDFSFPNPTPGDNAPGAVT